MEIKLSQVTSKLYKDPYQYWPILELNGDKDRQVDLTNVNAKRRKKISAMYPVPVVAFHKDSTTSANNFIPYG